MSYVGTKERPLFNALTSEDFWIGIVAFGLLGGVGVGGGLLTLGIVAPGGAPLPVSIICIVLGLFVVGVTIIPVTEAAKDITHTWQCDKRRNERIEERKAEQVIEEAHYAAQRLVEAKKASHRAEAELWSRRWDEALAAHHRRNEG